MSKKCYVGKPIEFKAKYEGVLKCYTEPDNSQVCGLFVKNFTWKTSPVKIHIGKGFYIEPDLPYGIKKYGSLVSSDLELIVTGPGLPTNGQRVTFKWGLVACASYTAVTGTTCKQFINVEAVKSKSGTSNFTIEFFGGYTEQQYMKGWNVATWRICYGGPYESITLKADLPKNSELGWIPSYIWELINKLKKLGGDLGAELSPKVHLDAIETAIIKLSKVQVPKDQEKLNREIIESLQQSKIELDEANSLLKHSNEVVSEDERLELRAIALDHLEKACNLSSQAIELFSRLEETLKKKRWYTYLDIKSND